MEHFIDSDSDSEDDAPYTPRPLRAALLAAGAFGILVGSYFVHPLMPAVFVLGVVYAVYTAR